MDDWRNRVIVTTTPTIEGRAVRDYLGVVTGEAILGANVVRDFFASVTDVIGGRASMYEGELRRARDIALSEMAQEAVGRGANAVLGVDLDYEVIREGMLMVSASGTAVRVE